MNQRNLSIIWSELFPLHRGQRIRVVSIAPLDREKKGALITQGGFGLDMVGVEGTIVEVWDDIGTPFKYLVELDKSFALEHSSNFHRTRLWLAFEELEVIV